MSDILAKQRLAWLNQLAHNMQLQPCSARHSALSQSLLPVMQLLKHKRTKESAVQQGGH